MIGSQRRYSRTRQVSVGGNGAQTGTKKGAGLFSNSTFEERSSKADCPSPLTTSLIRRYRERLVTRCGSSCTAGIFLTPTHLIWPFACADLEQQMAQLRGGKGGRGGEGGVLQHALIKLLTRTLRPYFTPMG